MKSFSRREVTGGILALAIPPSVSAKADAAPLRFGLTPVFLTNDLELLSRLRFYLEQSTGFPVQLVSRRTYQEITALLVSGQLDAAWICGFPFVQYREALSLVAVPTWRGRPLYQAYLLGAAGRKAVGIDDLKGDVHAFSDPDSNSGYLVTRALLAERHVAPEQFFRKTFFTYGHRNVVRAVASGLAQSGSVDGYVWEVMSEVEPDLTGRTMIAGKSEWLGFPPVACPKALEGSAQIVALSRALIEMKNVAAGRDVLGMLRLDGFEAAPPGLFDAIAAKMELVRNLG